MKKILDTKGMILCALFAALTAAGALIAVPLPFSPVPISLQVLFVFLSGAMLGRYLGALSQLIYLLLGIVGLPVFSRGASGIGIIIGPTGGYLAGFVFSAFFIGAVFEKKKNLPVLPAAGVMIAGLLVIYMTGTMWLMYVARLNPVKAVIAGVLPFFPGDILKAFIAAFVLNNKNIKTLYNLTI